MKIEKISYNSLYTPNANSKVLAYPLKKSGDNEDLFVQTKKSHPNNISFSGYRHLYLYKTLVTKYLKYKTYKMSIFGSKRPYLSIKHELKDKIKPVQIPVNALEKINAFDINPKKSKKYVIFLHGFSQNITSNQELYKSLLDTNYGVLAIDYRAYGMNPKSINISESHIEEDILAAKKYLKDKGIKSIGLVGHSFGAYMSSKASRNSFFDFQILVSPMMSLKFWHENVVRHPKKYKRENFMIKYIPYFGKVYDKVFRLLPNMKDNTTPTYVIYSKFDRYIPHKNIDKFVNTSNSVKSHVLIPKGGHRMDSLKISAIKDYLLNIN